jgi:hypothetical protein
MADQTIGNVAQGSPASQHSSAFVAAVNIPQGAAVYINSSGQIALAQANALGTSGVIGIAPAFINEGNTGPVQFGGSLKLPAPPAGSPVPGAPIFLSPTVPGGLTTVEPASEGQYDVQLGYLEATTSSLLVLLNAPVVA